MVQSYVEGRKKQLDLARAVHVYGRTWAYDKNDPIFTQEEVIADPAAHENN